MNKIKFFIKNNSFFYPLYFYWALLFKLKINIKDVFHYGELSTQDTFELHTQDQDLSDSPEIILSEMKRQKKYNLVLPHIPKGSKVLDLACGRGELEVFLKEHLDGDVEYTGLDYTSQRVESAKKLGRNVYKMDCSDKEKLLKYIDENGPYDFIFCIYALTVFNCPEDVLRSLKEKSKKIIVGVANNGHWIYRLRFLFGRTPVASISHAANFTTNFDEIKRWWTYRDYKFIFKSLGFRYKLLSIKSGVNSVHTKKSRSFIPSLFAVGFFFLLENEDID